MGWHDNLIEEDDDIREILRASRKIAVIGIKDENHNGEPAYRVPAYLQQQGFEIIPINPNYRRALGRECLRSVTEIPEPVDMVLVFRAPRNIPQHADEVLKMPHKPRVFWMQTGIRHMNAARKLANAGIRVVQDHCIYREHLRLIAAH